MRNEYSYGSMYECAAHPAASTAISRMEPHGTPLSIVYTAVAPSSARWRTPSATLHSAALPLVRYCPDTKRSFIAYPPSFFRACTVAESEYAYRAMTAMCSTSSVTPAITPKALAPVPMPTGM